MRTRMILCCALASAAPSVALAQGLESAPKPMPELKAIEAVPLGDLAGAAAMHSAAVIDNPFESDPQAVAAGKTLFTAMNCASCHGYDAKGGMGPDLTDKSWRYGGTPVQIYKSIEQGRPKGMPAWNRALPETEIWRIVAYIETLGGAFPANFYHGGLQGDRRDMIVPPGTRVADQITENLAGQQASSVAPKTEAPAESKDAAPPSPLSFGPSK